MIRAISYYISNLIKIVTFYKNKMIWKLCLIDHNHFSIFPFHGSKFRVKLVHVIRSVGHSKHIKNQVLYVNPEDFSLIGLADTTKV